MPRLTRAQRAKQDVDETVHDAPEAIERSPLNEISPNASPEQVAPVEELPKKMPARSKSKKGAKKGAKAKKGKTVEEVEVEANDVQQQDIDAPVSEEFVEVVSETPVAEQIEEDASTTASTEPHVSQVAEEHAVPEERPASPPAKAPAVRLTRRQLAKQEEELRQSQRAQSPPRQLEAEAATESVARLPAEQTQEEDAVSQNVDEIAPIEEGDAYVNSTEVENEVASQDVELEQQEVSSTVESEDAVPGSEETQSSQTHQEADLQLEPGASSEHTTLAAELPTVSQPETETIAPSVEVTSEPEPKTLAAERPCEASRTPTMSRTPSRRTSRSPSKSPMRIEESIEALDALEEALENVGKAVSHFDQGTEEKSPRKKAFPKEASTPSAARTKTPRKTPVATRVSKTPSAAPKSIKPTTSSLARASSVRVAPKELRKPSADTTDYLASKRRPVSVSFPTPPPPPKGRAPTKPTFQLSSEVVAAKLKAQKEERLKREAEREAEGVVAKPRPVSVSLVAKSTKAPTKPTFQLSSDAVAARLKAQKEERVKREAESAQNGQPKARPVSISMAPPMVKSSKPPTKANFQLPGEAVAAKLRAQREERLKREEEAEAAKKAAAITKARPTTVRKPVALPTQAQPGVSIPPPPPRQDSLQPPSQRSVSTSSNKRNSIQLSRSTSVSTNASNRNSLIITKSTVTPVDAVQQKIKGKEVFNRDKMEKDAKDRERREKEDAAKQARAQAAERGRAASREWAERQRQKMLNAVRAKAETT